MGWLFGWNSREELKTHLLKEQNGYNVLDSALTNLGRNLWVVFEHPHKYKFICLFLLAGGKKDGFGYKPVSEDMGPCEVDCPLRFFELAPLHDQSGTYAAKWRGRVKAHHAKKSVKYADGDEVLVHGDRFKIVGRYKRSYVIQCCKTGARYKCSAAKMTPAPKEATKPAESEAPSE